MSSLLGELAPCGGGDSIPLVKTKLLVGRSPSCDVVLPFPTISSRHCELEFNDGRWFVRDLASHNGIRVNGVRCDSMQLMPNDTLTVAQYRYTIIYSQAPGTPRGSVADWIERSLVEDVAWKQRQTPARGKFSGTVQCTLGELLPCGGGEPIPLLKPKLLVGRHATCDIVLALATISSRHCELEFKQGYWFVRDLASRNGIRVDGAPCESNWLRPNSVLWLAKHRFQVAYTPQAAEPPPEAEENPFARSLLEKAGLVSTKGQEDMPRPPSRRRADPDAPRERWKLD
jgi:pSer/pThr/pTyr-binding forkhead associated (FHA) protein